MRSVVRVHLSPPGSSERREDRKKREAAGQARVKSVPSGTIPHEPTKHLENCIQESEESKSREEDIMTEVGNANYTTAILMAEGTHAKVRESSKREKIKLQRA